MKDPAGGNDANGGASRNNPILVIAPLGRDAELACGVLAGAELKCRYGRSPGDLAEAVLGDLGALVLTEELLTVPAITALTGLLDAQPSWSNLPVILLVDPECRRMADPRGMRMAALSARPGVILLQRPMQAASFVTIARAAVLTRQKQHELRDQLDARERAEARARTLATEMKHRVKNAFAVADSIALQTFRHAESLNEAQKAFSSRMRSMARAQDLLAANGDARVDFLHVIDQALAPYQPEEEPGPFAIDGPQMRIPAEMATAFAMALHELATNAAKYGALSVASGYVTVRWRSEKEPSGATLLVFEWRESGGPRVTPPRRRGFGSQLIERALSSDLGGSAEMTFDLDGLVCTIRATIPEDAHC